MALNLQNQLARQSMRHIRACLKTHLGFNPAAFGVPPSGGSLALPPEGGTPSGVFKHALKNPSGTTGVPGVTLPGLSSPKMVDRCFTKPIFSRHL